MKFLHGLNSVFERASSQILLMEPLPSVDRAYSMIMQVEDELSLNNENLGGQNMMVLNAECRRSLQLSRLSTCSKGKRKCV